MLHWLAASDAGQPCAESMVRRIARTCSASESRVHNGEGGAGGLQPDGHCASMLLRLSHPWNSLLLDAHGSGGGAWHPSHSHAAQPGPHIPPLPHAQLH